MLKIALVSCYGQKGYVRTRTLTTAFEQLVDVEVIIIKNTQAGILRYPEAAWKILRARFTARPDLYLINFRGYEMLLYMVLSGVRKPIIFDEFINLTEWLDEHHRIVPAHLSYRVLRNLYGWLVRRCRLVLADTPSHAAYSAELNRLPISRYRVLPVGTDETVFYPAPTPTHTDQPFTVFYYGTMLPLHGLNYVLEAALQLRDNPGIVFDIIGGGKTTEAACRAAIEQGAHIRYRSWVPFEELADIARNASLTLGGPFGDTLQSRFVITGKTYQFLALGRPVLVGSNLETAIFTDKVNSLVVPQASADAIADAVRWSQQHPDELVAIGQAGRQLYEKHFSQAIINQQIKEMMPGLQTALSVKSD